MIELYGDTLVHGRVILTEAPLTSSDAVSLATVQNLISSSKTLTPCRIAVQGNISLNGLPVLQGVTLTSGMRILVLSQTNPVDNGIYLAASGSWSRSADYADGTDGSNTIVAVLDGDSSNLVFKSQIPSLTIGTDPCYFTYVTGTSSSSIFSSRSVNSSGVVLSNDSYILVDCSSSNISLDLPVTSSVSSLGTVKVFRIIKTDNTDNILTLRTNGGETFLDGRTTFSSSTPGRQFDITSLSTIQKYSVT